MVYLGVLLNRQRQKLAKTYVVEEVLEVDIRQKTLEFLEESFDAKANVLLKLWGFYFAESVALFAECEVVEKKDM